jgi:hypothetical protein
MPCSSKRFFAVFALALCGLEISAVAGDKEVTPPRAVPVAYPSETPIPPRKEYHLSLVYPFVFRPEGYLVADKPVGMRYGAPAIDLSDRIAPPLPVAAEGLDDLKKEKEAEKAALAAMASPTPTPDDTPVPPITASAEPPAYPVPQNAPTPVPKGSADFSQAPDEVQGYFRNQYNFVPDTHRFFDPIFEPAEAPPQSPVVPNTAQFGPHSTATFNQTP